MLYPYTVCYPCISFSAYCPKEIGEGIIWPMTERSTKVSIACNVAGSLFRQGTFITRTCTETGVWDSIDLSTCTLVSDASQFILLSFVLETEGNSTTVDEGIESSQLEAAVITFIEHYIKSN